MLNNVSQYSNNINYIKMNYRLDKFNFITAIYDLSFLIQRHYLCLHTLEDLRKHETYNVKRNNKMTVVINKLSVIITHKYVLLFTCVEMFLRHIYISIYFKIFNFPAEN